MLPRLINQHKNKLLYIALLAAVTFSVTYIRDFSLSKQLDSKKKELIRLTSEIDSLRGEKKVLADKVAASVLSYEQQKARAELAEKKLKDRGSIVIPPPPPGSDFSPECMDALESVKTQCEVRELDFFGVIEEKNKTIEEADTAIKDLIAEVEKDNQIISAYAEKDKVCISAISALENQLSVEESRKKKYRTATGVLGIACLFLLL